MFSYLIDLYHRAITNRALTPRERASLKAVQGVIIGAVTDLAYQLVPILARGGRINITQAGVVSLLFGFLLGLFKLWAAQSDPLVGTVLDAYSKELEQQGIKQITTQVIDGQTHVPVISLHIPSSVATASTSLVKSPVTSVQEDLTSASTIVQKEDRAKQFATPATWTHNAETTVPMPQDIRLTETNT